MNYHVEHHEDQNPELEIDKHSEQNKMTDDDDTSPIAHLFSVLVFGKEQGIPEKEVNLGIAEEMGNIGKNEHLELPEIKEKPAEIVQEGEGDRSQYDFLVQSSVHRELMVKHMADPEMQIVVPGQKAEQAVKKLVQPFGFKRSAVAELVNSRLHPHKAVEDRVEIGDSDHRNP
ncbi:hypothetical protein ES708_28167 [subsurface metagenome]